MPESPLVGAVANRAYRIRPIFHNFCKFIGQTQMPESLPGSACVKICRGIWTNSTGPTGWNRYQ